MVRAGVGLFVFVQDERALNTEGITDARARALGLCWTGMGAQIRNEHYVGGKILGPNPDPDSLLVEGIVPIIGRTAESPPKKTAPAEELSDNEGKEFGEGGAKGNEGFEGLSGAGWMDRAVGPR